MGAGAVQTMVNVHRVRPGGRAVMVGAGNVGLIVAYQLVQAGIEVVRVVEAAARVSGYGVHAARLRRTGVPILTDTTVAEAQGGDRVERVRLDPSGEVIECDLVCLAVGLRPQPELCQMAGCRLEYHARTGWHVPARDENRQTSVAGLFVAGDVCGIEEASTAMEEGEIAGTAAALYAAGDGVGVAPEALLAARERLAELRGPLDRPLRGAV
jgi:sarcosine oxidase subunit alpha